VGEEVAAEGSGSLAEDVVDEVGVDRAAVTEDVNALPRVEPPPPP
jgi:hypothetical protein